MKGSFVALRRSPWVWAVGAMLGLAQYLSVAVAALQGPLQRFDEGILLSATGLLSQGQVPLLDFYIPYGWGLGLPGLPAMWFFDGEAIAVHMCFALAPGLLTCVAYVLGTRRLGLLAGLSLALLTFPADVYRYALTWCAVFGFALLVDGALRGSSVRTLRAALLERSCRLGAAGALLGLAPAIRPEYAILMPLWSIVLALHAPSLDRWARAAVPGLVVAFGPYALIAVAGGLDGLLRYADYVLFHFGSERGRQIAWWTFGPDAPYAVRTVVWLSYGAAAALAIAWAWRLARRERPLDATGLALFLAMVCLIVMYAQVRTFAYTQGALAMPIVWLAVAMFPARRPHLLVGVLATAALLTVTLPSIRDTWPFTAYRNAKDGLAASYRDESVPGLDRIVLSETAPALASLAAMWVERVRDRSEVFALNRRNDQTHGNEAFTYWFLGSKAAAWPVAFDPGLADREDVQRDVVEDLCRRRPPIVQHTVAYVLPGADPAAHGSRYLDQFVAVGYRVVGANDLFRVLLPERARCRTPDEVPSATVLARRDALLAADDLPAAGALSVLLVERARRAGRRPAAEDVAGALLGGYWIEDDDMPGGVVGEALRALRSPAPAPMPAPAGIGPPLLRLAAQTAYLRGRTGASPEDRAALPAMRRLALEQPHWPVAARNLFALQPPSDAVYSRLRRAGARHAALERWRFDYRRAAGDLVGAAESARLLLAHLDREPLERGRVLTDLSAAYAAAGDEGCAAAALVAADRIPGVDATPPPNTPACGRPLP